MADDPQPFYVPGLKVTQPRPAPGELLFSFRTPDHRQVDCQLRDHGDYGVEAQFYIDREFSLSVRFDTRALAIEWAELERRRLEHK